MPGWLIAMGITYAIVLIFALIALGWKEELKTVRKELQSMKAIRGERR